MYAATGCPAMSSSSSDSPHSGGAGQVAPGEIRILLRQYLTSAHLTEIVYRDDAGQVQTTHDVIRDLFSRAGQDFVYLGRGQMLRLDHVLTLDGRPVAPLFQS